MSSLVGFILSVLYVTELTSSHPPFSSALLLADLLSSFLFINLLLFRKFQSALNYVYYDLHMEPSSEQSSLSPVRDCGIPCWLPHNVPRCGGFVPAQHTESVPLAGCPRVSQDACLCCKQESQVHHLPSPSDVFSPQSFYRGHVNTSLPLLAHSQNLESSFGSPSPGRRVI